KTRWGSLATCFNSIVQNQLALKLTITKLSHDSHTTVPDAISDIITCESFWENIESLLIILDKLVTGISTFESDTPRLALFYQWYHEQLESDNYVFLAVGCAIKNLLENRWKKIYQPVLLVVYLLDPQCHEKKLPANGMLTISTFIQRYYSEEANIIWQQLLQYKTQTENFEAAAPELYKVALRILTIPSSSAASERNWSNFSYIHDKKQNQPCKNHKFELLDSDNNDESSEDELIESNNNNEDIELSESEIELLSESDVDSKDE
ncbi:37787_t:CDS:2, partial [Gigaspora margarita]